MKKLITVALLCCGVMFFSGCGVVNYGKKTAYKAEIKHATEWKEEKLEKKLSELIKKGDLTEKQAEKIRDGAYWLLDCIINRAETKLNAMKEKNGGQ